MQHLHAYWRMAYIEAPKPTRSNHPFSDLPLAGDDRASLILHRSSLCYLLLNKYPYNAGHLLVVPFREVVDISELTPAERLDMMDTIVIGEELLRATIKPDGFNVGFNLGSVSGGSIPHLHAHIVPRWMGDTNFMPILSDTRLLVESITVMYDKFAKALPGVLERIGCTTACSGKR